VEEAAARVVTRKRRRQYTTHLARICDALSQARAQYVLVGAAAMQLWGTTRATRDIDILIEPTVANGCRVLEALTATGMTLADQLSPEDLVRRPVTVIGDIPNVDVLTRAWNVMFDDARRTAVVFDLEGVKIPTASIEHLIESKRTGRLQDAADIEVLEEIRRLRSAHG
jgi:hypothetical protein